MQQQFPALGTGSLAVQVPNGGMESELVLQDVLHAPSVGYTLVSLGALDKLGYRATLGGGCYDSLTFLPSYLLTTTRWTIMV